MGGWVVYLLVLELQVPPFLLEDQGVIDGTGVEDSVQIHVDEVIEVLFGWGGRVGGWVEEE